MKLLIFSLLLGASLLSAQNPSPVTSASLDESEVRITYGELKRLLAATLPKELPAPAKPVPPVPAALLASAYEWNLKTGVITAEMHVENFDGGWQSIPLATTTTGAVAVEPEDARLVIKDDHLCLLSDKAGAQTVRLTFAKAGTGDSVVLGLAPSPLAVLTVTDLPQDRVARIQSGSSTRVLAAAGAISLPANGGEVTVELADAHGSAPPSQEPGATDDAIITAAAYATQVVRDGSVLTEGTITVRHDQPTRLALVLPEAARLLQCHVNGAAVRPQPQPDGRWEVPLDDPATDGAESEVRLSFTATVSALQPAEGELNLALPQTPLFARQIDWNVQLPEGYDLAFSGNVDATADKAAAASPGLHLRKSLSRDQQPQARITYRKRTSN